MLSTHVPRSTVIKKIGHHGVITLVRTVPPHAVNFPVLVFALNWDNHDYSDTPMSHSRSPEVDLYPVWMVAPEFTLESIKYSPIVTIL